MHQQLPTDQPYYHQHKLTNYCLNHLEVITMKIPKSSTIFTLGISVSLKPNLRNAIHFSANCSTIMTALSLNHRHRSMVTKVTHSAPVVEPTVAATAPGVAQGSQGIQGVDGRGWWELQLVNHGWPNAQQSF